MAGFPYQNYGQKPTMEQFQPFNIPAQQQPQITQSTSNIIWVPGIEGTNAYLVTPGNAIALWDNQNQTIYIKSTDTSGVQQPLRILDYTERTVKPETVQNTGNFATKDDLQNISDKLQELSDNISQMRSKYADQRNNYKKGGNGNGQ